VTRIALGIVIAVARPAIASLTGDLFPAQERGRMFGYIRFGELLDAGLGYLVAGNLASIVSWRASFLVLSVPGVLLAVALARLLPVPARGGQSRIDVGDTEILPAQNASDDAAAAPDDEQAIRVAEGAVGQGIRAAHIRPHRDQVLHEDPVTMGTGRALRYMLSVRTNVLLIAASTIGLLLLRGFAGIRSGVPAAPVRPWAIVGQHPARDRRRHCHRRARRRTAGRSDDHRRRPVGRSPAGRFPEALRPSAAVYLAIRKHQTVAA
jgi:MFS family permease